MASVKEEVESVKVALKNGTATTSTVTILQSLLSLDTNGRVVIADKRADELTAATTSRRTAALKAKPVVKTKKNASVKKHEDAPKALLPRERYALATEVVNITLKVLTDALKPCAALPGHTTDRAGQIQPVSKRALQPRSGNETPTPPRQGKAAQTRRSSSLCSKSSHFSLSSIITATAECARLGFTFLRSAHAQKLGVRDLPKLQLESGMLALIGKLISHGLESLAIKELLIVKRRLESLLGSQTNQKVSKTASKAFPALPEKETLAGLLCLEPDFEAHPEALPLVITHQMHVLRIVAVSRKSAVIEKTLKYLSLDLPASPSKVILLQAKLSGDNAKAAKQLEALSQTLLSLCPSISSASDTQTANCTLSPQPEIAFGLQTLALSIRKQWWKLAGHQPDTEKELFDPFAKCLSAFVRRSHVSISPTEVYEIARNAADQLFEGILDQSGTPRLAIDRTLCSLAEGIGRFDAALGLTEQMEHGCSDLASSHARALAVSVKLSSMQLRTGEKAELLDNIRDRLKETLTGQAADYDFLLIELASLARSMVENKERVDETALHSEIVYLAASFAQRFVRSYPGKGIQNALDIINAAVRLSNRVDDMLGWISHEAVDVVVASGCMSAVAKSARVKPLRDAWAVSSVTVAFPLLLKAVVLKAAKSQPEHCVGLLYDEENLDAAERGALLEMQLQYATEHASKTKYKDTLQRMIPELFRRLAKAYTATQYPLRRARVATSALRVRENHPDHLPPHALKVWQDSALQDREDFQEDEGLRPYAEDIKASFECARLFCQGRPSVMQLTPTLLSWQRIVDASTDALTVRCAVHDSEALTLQLNSITTYAAMLGEDSVCLATLRILVRLRQLLGEPSDEYLDTLSCLSLQYLSLGYSEKAGATLASAETLIAGCKVSTLAKLQYNLTYARYLLAIDNLDSCKSALDEARKARNDILPDKLAKQQKNTYEKLHADAWLLQSRYLLTSGMPHDAITPAKRAVKLFDGIWKRIERARGTNKAESTPEFADATDTEVGSLTDQVSKLKLLPKGSDSVQQSCTKGAAFWPLVPSICEALLHASDIYAHHGIFQEANFYSERALGIADSVASQGLSFQIRSHRAGLLIAAGRLEDAELCLATVTANSNSDASLAIIHRLRVKAKLREKEKDLSGAVDLYARAEKMSSILALPAFLEILERVGTDVDALAIEMEDMDVKPPATTIQRETVVVSRAKKVAAPAATTTRIKPTRPAPAKSAQARRPRLGAREIEADKPPSHRRPYLFSRLKADIAVEQALVLVRLGKYVSSIESDSQRAKPSITGTLKERRLQFQHLMLQATTALHSDITYNVLPESTLSYPAFSACDRPNSGHDAPQTLLSSSPKHGTSSTALIAKPAQRKIALQQSLDRAFAEARDCLLRGQSSATKYSTTHELHMQGGLLAGVSLLLSASAGSKAKSSLHPSRVALALESGRNCAAACQYRALSADHECKTESQSLNWPPIVECSSSGSLSTKAFHTDFVEILPKSWTAVSLSLSEDCSELLVTRYRSDQVPFLVRLPLSRHKSEEEDETIFDFETGRAELLDIVQLSNYSCHNGSDLSNKSAKSKWWSEREALDKRLHELLLNVENLWLGGFRGILSPSARQHNLLARFRTSFEAILDRYLPSRRATRASLEKLALDSNILQLFVALGSDNDGVVDLDEPLTDLLYFVVDMLQFNGERNAYDEIDFDSMVVEVLDALRAYHEATAEDPKASQHLVLVVDKRLQCFPWESLPCLDGVGVSRVDSMLTLRERILMMRQHYQKSHIEGEEQSIVSRKSGLYVLNPSSDLASTESILGPALSNLKAEANATWTSCIRTAPTEAELVTGLSDTSMLLYFGHGAGTQYIRQRAIRKLDRCSNVVWLMGCSSGAVTEHGELEPQAVPLTYLLAGGKCDGLGLNLDSECSMNDSEHERTRSSCMSVLSTLWDVTDKDIDRFSLAVGEEWGLWPPAAEPTRPPAKTPRKRDRVAAPSTPQQVPKTPKTPKVNKTPAATKTPARNRSRPRQVGEQKLSLNEAVAKSRDTCYLRYLNGAAPVVYGVPVYLGD